HVVLRAGERVGRERADGDEQCVPSGAHGRGGALQRGERVVGDRGGDLHALAVVHRGQPAVGWTLGGQLTGDWVADALGAPGVQRVAYGGLGGRGGGGLARIGWP